MENEISGDTPRLSKRLLIAIACLFFAYLSLALYAEASARFLSGSQSYVRLAERVLAGDWSFSYRPPLYPVFLAGTKLLFGADSLLLARSIQGFLALLTLFILGSKLIRFRPGSMNFFLVLWLSNIAYHFETLTIRESALYSFVVLCFLLTLISDLNPLKRTLILGALAALAHLIRPTGILLVVSAFMFDFFVHRAGFKRASQNLVYATLVFLSVILPWQYQLYKTTGALSLSSSSTGGLNLIKGNNPDFLRVFPAFDVDRYENIITKKYGIADFEDYQNDRQLAEIAKEFIVSHPFQSLRNSAIKFVSFFSPLPIPFRDGRLELEDGNLILLDERPIKASKLYFATFSNLLIWFGIVALLISKKNRFSKWEYSFFAGSFTIILPVVILGSLFFTETRFRIPFDPFLIFCSSIGWSSLAASLKSLIEAKANLAENIPRPTSYPISFIQKITRSLRLSN